MHITEYNQPEACESAPLINREIPRPPILPHAPSTLSANMWPLAQAKVQPKWPWPVFKYRFFTAEGPIIGADEGVMGRKPAQYSALS